MLIWPGVRRNVGGGAAQAIRNAPFWAPLKTSLVLARGVGSPTFTRATVATVMGFAADAVAGASQTLLTVASGEARQQGARRVSEGVWSPVLSDGTPIPDATLDGYLAEGARTNLFKHSDVMTAIGGAWDGATTSNVVKSDITSVIAPNGVAACGQIAANAGAGFHYATTTGAVVTSGAPITSSIYVKTDTTWLFFTHPSDSFLSYFNASTGAFGTMGDGVTGVAENAGDGWWRVSLTCTKAITSAVTGVGFASGDGGANYTAAGTEVAYVWRWGMEDNAAFASTPIPTTTAAVTRNADLDSLPTAGNILAAQGTLYTEITPQHAPSGTVFFWGTYVDASNYTALLHDGTNLTFRKRIAGVNYDATIANAFVAGTTYKVAASWGASGTSVYLNGTAGTPHANTTAAQIAATMQIGADGNGANQPFAAIKNDRIWLTQLPASIQGAITR